ncbi:hypothetical protein BJ322DRAFT_1112466 [Thelephora terrestris]|uniref:Uncharacterized protein n=1 Tax=Thelephora terrestris TaxID=56493 RepID=A0A9P6H9D4_9AGAM|nr:hypothetical protein BJ322DRAFT_1112466 [Thelephora terrestris]
MPRRSRPQNIQDELDLLIAAADEFRDSELPEPTAAREKRGFPDDNEGNSAAGDEDNEPGAGENEAGLENYTPSEKQLFVQNLAKRLKLNSAQAADIDRFSKETLNTKLVVLYGETMSLSAKVNKLAESVGPANFVLTKAITDNIKHIVRHTFLDPAVKDYKAEDTIKLLVVDKIRQSLDGIPKDLERTNPQAWHQVESRVGYEVTQLRGSIKKVLKEDSALEPAKQMKLFALTKAIMTRTSESDIHKFGVETFMRVALFRKVYPKHPGENFWDTVDDWLAEMFSGGKAAYEKAMAGLVALDRKTYGVQNTGDIAQ